MRVYNTLSRRKEEFVPLHQGKVGFYICGPTVYNNIHIGNARTFLSFDVIRRYFEYCGYTVDYVQNITDVDDKIINRALEEGRSASEVAADYTQAFIDAMRALGVKDPTIRPKATEEIPAMIELITCLVQNRHAYVIDSDVYFSVRSFAAYGTLSGRKLDDLVAGARVDVDERKRDPFDFALWKAAKPGEPSWMSPWGEGRPGWHIECSAMSERYLGTPFDIHAGGEDLIFPHHENELAQSEACYHNGFARYWLHGGMLTIDKEKMSKSEGNYLLLKDVLEYVRPQALRLLMLQTHYRSPFDYSPARLDEATAALGRIEGALGNIQWALHGSKGETGQSVREVENSRNGDTTCAPTHTTVSDPKAALHDVYDRFKASMDDDFNTAGAVAVVFELVSKANHILAKNTQEIRNLEYLSAVYDTIIELMAVLGVELEINRSQKSLVAESDQHTLLSLAKELASYTGFDTNEALDALISARSKARMDKNWALADAVRDGLCALGLVVEDTPQGPRLVHE